MVKTSIPCQKITDVSDNLSSLESTGFPRTLKQAETLQQSESVNVVISLDVPEDEIVQR